ncbi:2'-5' RNA ligase family protein [Nocardioides marmoriginsengisoli]|uniref:2'-5' RNA ligase family protein n=1 Tax=Nocardioides marmoriginsengisoli TaxID=661483 RepID=UPI0016172D61|nr:2'-5' RNA ligase family protein [Nocardioides marmoriginsengisoli]
MDSAPVPAAASNLPMTGIIVPVREAETLVRARMLQVTPELLPQDRSLVAHITLLAPFHPESDVDDAIVEHLAGFFAEVTPFGFELTELCEFPRGITYLAPEPASTFRRLTAELHRQFPEFPPYGGEFDDIVPHLTVPLTPGETTDDLRTALGSMLPIHAFAREALLVHAEEGATHVIATFPFGTTAA